jgi:hypothetical protein
MHGATLKITSVYVYTYVAHPVIPELVLLTLISEVAVDKFYNKNGILASCNS